MHFSIVLDSIHGQNNSWEFVNPRYQDGHALELCSIQLARDNLLSKLPHIRVSTEHRSSTSSGRKMDEVS